MRLIWTMPMILGLQGPRVGRARSICPDQLPGDTRRHNCAYYGAYYGWSYFPALPKQKILWGPVKKATPQQPLQGTRATSDFRLPTSEAPTRYDYCTGMYPGTL